VQEYYEKRSDDFAAEQASEPVILFVPADASLPEAERASRRGAIEEVLEKIKAGAEPERLVERLAAGDKSAPLEIDRGELPSDIERKVASMQEGEVTGVLQSERGFYIVKVPRADARGGLEDPELRAKIESALRTERVQKKYDQWLNRLREKARISIYFRPD
jgi:parvulin-like peptidyl-prolyl isomerase